MAKLLNVPIGIVVFVEEEEEVSLDLNYGLEPGLDWVNRGETMCSVAMLREETTVLENLHDHPCDLVGPCWCSGTWASTRAVPYAPRPAAPSVCSADQPRAPHVQRGRTAGAVRHGGNELARPALAPAATAHLESVAVSSHFRPY